MEIIGSIALFFIALTIGSFVNSQIWLSLFYSFPKSVIYYLKGEVRFMAIISNLLAFAMWMSFTFTIGFFLGILLPSLSEQIFFNKGFLVGWIYSYFAILFNFFSKKGRADMRSDYDQSTYSKYKKIKTNGSLSIEEAEDIVVRTGEAFAKGNDSTIARPESLLPCSKDKIKEAYFIFSKALIENGKMTPKIKDALIGTYLGLGAFVPDKEASDVNKIYTTLKFSDLDFNDKNELYKRYSEFLNKSVSSEDAAELSAWISKWEKHFEPLNKFVDRQVENAMKSIQS